MWDVVLTSGLAIAGTLAGSWTTARQQTRARREQQSEERRQQAIDDVAALQSALANHRRTMTVYEHARVTGADEDRLAALRAETHETRAAITGRQVRVKMTMPELADAVDEAVAAVYAIGQSVHTDDGTPELDGLEARRLRARETSDAVTMVAARALATRDA